jgi:hypothetical protein
MSHNDYNPIVKVSKYGNYKPTVTDRNDTWLKLSQDKMQNMLNQWCHTQDNVPFEDGIQLYTGDAAHAVVVRAKKLVLMMLDNPSRCGRANDQILYYIRGPTGIPHGAVLGTGVKYSAGFAITPLKFVVICMIAPNYFILHPVKAGNVNLAVKFEKFITSGDWISLAASYGMLWEYNRLVSMVQAKGVADGAEQFPMNQNQSALYNYLTGDGANFIHPLKNHLKMMAVVSGVDYSKSKDNSDYSKVYPLWTFCIQGNIVDYLAGTVKSPVKDYTLPDYQQVVRGKLMISGHKKYPGDQFYAVNKSGKQAGKQEFSIFYVYKMNNLQGVKHVNDANLRALCGTDTADIQEHRGF